MYSRSYDDTDTLTVPEGYGGTSMMQGLHNGEAISPEPEEYPADTVASEESVSAGMFSGLLSKLPFGNMLGDVFGHGKFGIQKLGTEELLIIAAAAFLFFSRDGDRECAILLVLLLFIS